MAVFYCDWYDLEHRIKKKDILSIREVQRFLRGKTLLIEYWREDNRPARLEFALARFDEFKQALEQGFAITAVR